jgi:creatinine amidohydrolase
MIWEYLREEEFEEVIKKSKGVCAMPLGCLEMHGQHLPVGTDILKASYILRKASEIEPVCVFPDFTFGDVQGHTRRKGGIRLTVELEQRLLTELCAEIARNGFKKVVLVNSHGGNIPLLRNFIRSTGYSKKDYVVILHHLKLASPYMLMDLFEKNGREYFPELNDDDIEVLRDFVEKKKILGHAGFAETAIMLGTYPELVRMDKIHDLDGLPTGLTRHLDEAGETFTRFSWGKNYPNAYKGHAPEGCNERIGKATVRVMVENLVRMLRAIKNDDQMLKWNDEWNNAW